jgi:hypothetical protein
LVFSQQLVGDWIGDWINGWVGAKYRDRAKTTCKRRWRLESNVTCGSAASCGTTGWLVFQ